ncbi:hypothetical protein Acid7E03_33050 [Acidisoma sp. 7E03]
MSAIRPRLSWVHIPSLNQTAPSRHNHFQTASKVQAETAARAAAGRTTAAPPAAKRATARGTVDA